jgi:hypothetical protein
MKLIRICMLIVAGAVMVFGAGAIAYQRFESSRQAVLTGASVGTCPTPTSRIPSPTLTPKPAGGPAGIPIAYGWDGVDGRMMLSGFTTSNGLDTSTWTFDGTEWSLVATRSVAGLGGPNVLVFDCKRDRELLVTGDINQGVQTFEWDGVSWQPHFTSHLPKLFTQHASGAYSPEMDATVVLELPVTWLYDGTDWRSVTTAHNPESYSHLEYDVTRKAIVALSLDDFRTWLFDGTDWKPLPLNGPTPTPDGGQFSVALDQKRDVWVVFKGFADNMITDTWTGNGVSWAKRAPAISPSRRLVFSGDSNLAWDPTAGRLLLFGGQHTFGLTAEGPMLGDTWSWDGNNWSQVA